VVHACRSHTVHVYSYGLPYVIGQTIIFFQQLLVGSRAGVVTVIICRKFVLLYALLYSNGESVICRIRYNGPAVYTLTLHCVQ